MTSFVGWIAPPGVGVVEPPLHPLTVVDLFYSDGSTDENCSAGLVNWSAVGDGPSIVAYAVVREYKPAPELREWWKVGSVLKNSRAEAEEFRVECDRISPDLGFLNYPIIHVREVPDPSREVVAWAVIGDDGLALSAYEGMAEAIARDKGGTVVRLSGVVP